MLSFLKLIVTYTQASPAVGLGLGPQRCAGAAQHAPASGDTVPGHGVSSVQHGLARQPITGRCYSKNSHTASSCVTQTMPVNSMGDCICS